MSLSPYLLFFILPVIFAIVAFFYFVNKGNSRTDLYSEGLRNENDGHFNKALLNYQQALSESDRLKRDKKFREKIIQKIKILRTNISYKENFERGTGIN